MKKLWKRNKGSSVNSRAAAGTRPYSNESSEKEQGSSVNSRAAAGTRPYSMKKLEKEKRFSVNTRAAAGTNHINGYWKRRKVHL